VGDSGFEPLTSSASRKYDGLLEDSGACKTRANRGIWSMTLFLSFQVIYSGCCTVAAHGCRLAEFTASLYCDDSGHRQRTNRSKTACPCE
jgi:hypothetical protein